MINKNYTEGKWKEIKGSIQKAWGNLTSDELDKTEGDATKIAGMLQAKYGLAQEDARSQLHKIFSRFEEKSDNTKN